ncbi:MAG: hypothetical protein C0609_04765 [Deltaproteobacteria bacterium]|nr:MAG: hypothetical protein C0609_04765 [Deltaproteobacteria bacterium]
MRKPLPSRLLAIADLSLLGEDLFAAVAAAAEGGVDWFLLRAKGFRREVVRAFSSRLMGELPGITLSIHGDANLALELGASGCHFAAGVSLPENCALITGASCHDPEEVLAAGSGGADYGFLSPVYEPTSKRTDLPTLGADGFKRIASATDLPLYALGGMTPATASRLFDAGACGVAVSGDLFLAADISARGREWVEAVKVFKE